MFRNWLRNFMIGRYGPDHLGVATLVLSVLMMIVAGIFRLVILAAAAYLMVALTFFRMISRNIKKRRAENDRFLRVWWPVRTWFKKQFRHLKERRQYRFFKCPACGGRLRVPKGKGKIRITCPKCGERFDKKT